MGVSTAMEYLKLNTENLSLQLTHFLSREKVTAAALVAVDDTQVGLIGEFLLLLSHLHYSDCCSIQGLDMYFETSYQSCNIVDKCFVCSWYWLKSEDFLPSQ